MTDTKSMILGDGGGGNLKPPVPPVISQAEPVVPKKIEPLPAQFEDTASLAPTEASEPPRIKSLTDFTNEIYKDRLPSEEELAKEQKREKSRRVISAIADGVSAISNLYFTSKGANNVEQTSMSAANAKRYQTILDRRRKTQGEWDNARLAAYDRDRGFEYQKGRDNANWERSGKWHDDQVKTEADRFSYNKGRQEKVDADNKESRDKNYELSKKGQENQEKAQKDASARGWAAVGAQNKRIEAQDRKQKEQSKYQFGKLNGSPEPKMINHTQSIYIGKNVWEQNAGQIAGEILRDLQNEGKESAKNFERAMQGGINGKGISAKDMAALVDKYIMDSPSAQKLAVELEKDYKKRYELAANGSLPQDESDDLGFTPSSSGSGSSVDVDSLFD